MVTTIDHDTPAGDVFSFHVIEDREVLPRNHHNLIDTLRDNGWAVEHLETGYWGAFCWTNLFVATEGTLSLRIEEAHVYAKSYYDIETLLKQAGLIVQRFKSMDVVYVVGPSRWDE